MNKLKELIKNWLFKKELKEIAILNSEIQNLKHEFTEIYEVRSEMRIHTEALREANRMVSECLNIGVDVYVRKGSWAVVCLKGKTEYVKFIDLSEADLRQIQHFLRSFPNSNIGVDASPFDRRMLMEWRE